MVVHLHNSYEDFIIILRLGLGTVSLAASSVPLHRSVNYRFGLAGLIRDLASWYTHPADAEGQRPYFEVSPERLTWMAHTCSGTFGKKPTRRRARHRKPVQLLTMKGTL